MSFHPAGGTIVSLSAIFAAVVDTVALVAAATALSCCPLFLLFEQYLYPDMNTHCFSSQSDNYTNK